MEEQQYLFYKEEKFVAVLTIYTIVINRAKSSIYTVCSNLGLRHKCLVVRNFFGIKFGHTVIM